jgi:hypothetical protein
MLRVWKYDKEVKERYLTPSLPTVVLPAEQQAQSFFIWHVYFAT